MIHVDLAAARAGIDEFWRSWPELRAGLDEALRDGDTDAVVGVVAPRVAAIHADLAWEHMKGRAAANALVVSAEGDRRRRSTAERWLRAAPPPDGVWEFHSARQPDREAFERTLRLDDVDLPLGETRVAFSVDRERRLVDVEVHHPNLRKLGESGRTRFAFLVLDWLLGEEGVERWIGGVTTAKRQRRGKPLDALAAVVDELALAGSDTGWVLMQAETAEGLPVVATAMQGLSPAARPLFDLHVAVELPYREQNEALLPVGGSSEALNSFEDELIEQLGADGIIVARDAVGGVRTIHVYADAESDAASIAHELAVAWTEGEAVVRSVLDPAWSSVAHLRT